MILALLALACKPDELTDCTPIAEVCNGLDDDCDGAIDDDPADGETFWQDRDGDGYGDDMVEAVACEAPDGFATVDGDCDDLVATTNPFAAEQCNGVDDDCDGTTDDGAPGARSWWVDDDEDGYGDPGTELIACDPPDGYVDNEDDCNDGDVEVNPAGTEVCNGEDDDCDEGIDEGVCELDPPTFDVTWDSTGVTVTVTNLVGTGFDLGLAETWSGASGWYGEDCYKGTGSYNYCHAFTGDEGRLTSVYPSLDKVVEGKTTLLSKDLAFDKSTGKDRITYLVTLDSGDCLVTGHQPAYYAAFGCAEL